jgi:protein gp37
MPTAIEWTDETWNPVTGCSKISPGCRLCYAKALHDMRHTAFLAGKPMPAQYSAPFEKVQCWPKRLDIPLRWRAPRLCFINSMADLFHEDVPFEFISSVLFVAYNTPHITYQCLTKRDDRMLEFFSSDRVMSYSSSWTHLFSWPLLNFWAGVSVESKKYLYRLDRLRQVPAAVRMVSFEPLLEDLGEVNLQGIGWAIIGGMSGRRGVLDPMHVAWVRYLVEQCDAQGVPVFVKQVGGFPFDWADYIPKFWPKGTRYGAGLVSKSLATRRRPAAGMGDWANKAGTFIKLRDPKGGDPAEWPEDLRRREFPKPYPGHQVIRLQRKAVAA